MVIKTGLVFVYDTIIKPPMWPKEHTPTTMIPTPWHHYANSGKETEKGHMPK
jgi:hypothetical protein